MQLSSCIKNLSASRSPAPFRAAVVISICKGSASSAGKSHSDHAVHDALTIHAGRARKLDRTRFVLAVAASI